MKQECKALECSSSCESYWLKLSGRPEQSLGILRMFLPLIGYPIRSDRYCIKAYWRKDGIGFCITEPGNRLCVPKVQTNFLVVKPKQGVDYYKRGEPNNFANMSFDKVRMMERSEVLKLIEEVFNKRAADLGFSCSLNWER